MEKHFSIKEAIKHGITNAWQCKWVALEISASLILTFIGFFLIVMLSIWLFDAVFGKHAATLFISITTNIRDKLNQFATPATTTVNIQEAKTISRFIIYAVTTFILATPVYSSFVEYFYKKVFLLRAKQGHVTFQEVWSNWKGLWQVLLVHIVLTLPLFFIAGIVLMPLLLGTTLLTFALTAFFALFLFFMLGLLYALRLRFVSCFIIDQNKLAIESIKASYHTSRHNVLRIFGYLLGYGLTAYVFQIFIMTMISRLILSPIFIILNIFLAIVYLIALFIFYCGWHASDVYVYRALEANQDSQKPDIIQE